MRSLPIACVLLLAGCVQPLGKTWKADGDAFAIDLPADWVVEHRGSDYVFSAPKGSGGWASTVTVATALRDFHGNTRTLERAAEAIHAVLAQLEGARVVTLEARSLGEGRGAHAAYFADVTFTNGAKGQYRRHHYTIEHPNRLAYVSITAPAADFERTRRVGEAMLRTLRVSDQPDPQEERWKKAMGVAVNEGNRR